MINWKYYQLNSQDLKLSLVPAIGGRILSLSFQGQELLYRQENLVDEVYDFNGKNLLEEKKRLGFRLWGGDKTWVAPQAAWELGIPPLELDAGQYTIHPVEYGYRMESPHCRETGLKIIRQVLLIGSQVHLTESILNISDKRVSCGVWNVTQIKRPCYFHIPAHQDAIRSYHHEDPTLPPVEDLLWKDDQYKIECSNNQLFKYGGFPQQGSITTLIPRIDGSMISWRRAFEMDITADYAHRSAIEIFNSPDQPYAEAEVHAPSVDLKPGAMTSLSQCWTFG